MRIAWPSSPLADAPVYTDIGADGIAKFSHVTVTRGRNSATDQFQAGSMDVRALNYDREFEALTSASPYYPYVEPVKKIQFAPVHGGVAYPQFTGITGEIGNTYNSFGLDPRATLPATDGFRALSKARLTQTFDTEESSGTRIMRILDAANWPGTGLMVSAGHRSLDTGSQTVPAQRLKDTSALEAIFHVERSEFGRFFIAADGTARFIERGAFYENTLYADSQGVFGDDPNSTEYPYTGIAINYSDQRIHNHVVANRVGGPEQHARNQTSITKYFETTEPASELLLLSDNEAFDYAYYRLGREGLPQLAVPPITVDPLVDPDVLWPLVLTDLLQYKFTVRKRPRAGGLIEVLVNVDSIRSEWDFENGTCFYTYGMSIADPSVAWFLEKPGTQLGVNTYDGF